MKRGEVMELLNYLQDDDNLCKWFKYVYSKMSKSSVHKASSVNDMLNHFHISGYNDSEILNLSTMPHSIGERLPQLVSI